MSRKYSRRRRSSKKSTKRRKSKKMRGGVTTRSGVRRGNYRVLSPLKILKSTRLPSDVFGEILEMHPLFSTKLTNATIRRAVRDYSNSRSRAVVTKLFGKIENWDVSNVTDMSHAFCDKDCKYFNQPLNKWNVSNVTNMKGMFRGAISFNQPLNNWNVSKVTDMEDMFMHATSFNQPLHAPWYS